MSMRGHHRLFLVLLVLSLAVPSGRVFAQESVEQLFQQGNAAVMAGNHVRAEEIFRKVLQIDPNNTDAYKKLGDALRLQKKYDYAIAAYQKAIQLSPENFKAYNNLGNTLRQQGKYEQAITTLQRAIQLNPNDFMAFGNLGVTLRQQGKYDQAIINFQRAIQLNPNDSSLYGNLGQTLTQQHKYDQAIVAYQKAIQLNPTDLRAYNHLGNVLISQSRSDWRLFYNTANKLSRQEKYEQSVVLFQKAIQLNPNDSRTYFNLANTLSSQGKYDEAIVVYKKAIQLNPNDFALYGSLGHTLSHQGKYDEAIVVYKKAIQLNPNEYWAYNGIGYVFYKQGKYDQAISVYRKAIKINNEGSIVSRYNLGLTLAKQGNYEEAIIEYKAVIQTRDISGLNIDVYPDTPNTFFYTSAHINLGLIFKRLSQLTEAIKQFDIAESLDPMQVYATNNNIEARLLLMKQENELSQVEDDRRWLPQKDPNLKTKRSIVRIITEFSTEERPGTEVGTGIVIGRSSNRTLILTARHIIYDRDKQSKNIQVEFFSSPPANQVRMRRSASPLNIITNDKQLDLVVLEITDPLPEDIQPLPMSSTVITTDTPILIIGHDANRGRDLSWSVVSGKISNNERRTLTISQANIKPGYSGSPVLDSQNRLVGIIIETRKDKKQDFALPIAVIKNQLSLWNISSTP